MRLGMHQGPLTGIAFSPDGRKLASNGEDQRVKIWEVATGRELANFPNEGGGFGTIVFSPNGGVLASVNRPAIKLWDVETRREIRTLTDNSTVWDIVFTPDGGWLVSVNVKREIKVWEIATGRVARSLGSPPVDTGSHLGHLALSRDGRWLAYASWDKTIKLWDFTTGREVRTLVGHGGRVFSAAFSPDGRWLASGSEDRTVKLWDVETGKEVHTFTGHKNGVTHVAISPDGRLLASSGNAVFVCSWCAAGDHEVKLLDLATHQELEVLRQLGALLENWGASALCFSPDGRWLAGGIGYGREPKIFGTTLLYEVASLVPASTLKLAAVLAVKRTQDEPEALSRTGKLDKNKEYWLVALMLENPGQHVVALRTPNPQIYLRDKSGATFAALGVIRSTKADSPGSGVKWSPAWMPGSQSPATIVFEVPKTLQEGDVELHFFNEQPRPLRPAK